MRALLIVNPLATSTTPLRRTIIASAVASAVELQVVETRYRGHATSLAATAARSGVGLVLTLGGDGTVNEAVNGILGSEGAMRSSYAGSLPALAPLPGGNANVFTRSLGLPPDPVDAAGRILHALTDGRERRISVGLAVSRLTDLRYFTINAGLGLDAEVIRAVDGLRAHGRTVTPALYLRTALRQYFRITDRRRPALTLERDGHPPAGPLFLGVVTNTSPWTYLGRRAVTTNRLANFDSGLDVFGLRTLRTIATVRTLRQMLSPDDQPHGSGVLTLHDQPELILRAARPVALQIDGEYMGESECVRFVAVPDALRVLA